MKKLLIVDGSQADCRRLEEALRHSCITRSCSDGQSAQTLLRQFRPDILVMDLVLPQLDGLSLLHWLSQQRSRPMILVQTSLSGAYVSAQLNALGVDYVVVKPCPVRIIEEQVKNFLLHLESQQSEAGESAPQLSRALLELGLTPSLDGYLFLMHAIPRFAKDPGQAIFKELYAEVGAHFAKSAAQVERSIRNAISKAFWQSDKAIWGKYFSGIPHGMAIKPTNAQFIARMALLVSERCACR